MHLNHLAGLLPFFEPSIEWDDPMPSSHFRLDRPNSRGLHTFVPLPPSSHPPTMVSHGGIPSQMVLNPEPNLRPTTPHHSIHREAEHSSGSPHEPCNPVLTNEHSVGPTSGTPLATEPPRTTTRTTIPVPVRSKHGPHRQRTLNPRRNRNQPQSRKPVSSLQNGVTVLARFPSSPTYHLQTSTRMNQTTKEVVPHMNIHTRIPVVPHKAVAEVSKIGNL